MNFLVDKCHCNFFTTSSLCNVEVQRCQDTSVFPKGQQCKQISCVGLGHWKPWLSWLWVTCSQELPGQVTHSCGGRARTGRLCSLPAECILDINISNHFLSQLTLGVTMATTLQHRVMLSDVKTVQGQQKT